MIMKGGVLLGTPDSANGGLGWGSKVARRQGARRSPLGEYHTPSSQKRQLHPLALADHRARKLYRLHAANRSVCSSLTAAVAGAAGQVSTVPPSPAPAATIEGYGEGASTLVSKDQFRFLVDEPVKLGGLGKGAGLVGSWGPMPRMRCEELCNHTLVCRTLFLDVCMSFTGQPQPCPCCCRAEPAHHPAGLPGGLHPVHSLHGGPGDEAGPGGCGLAGGR